MAPEFRRKTPDELLREVQAEEAEATRSGHLKIMLGYASGVGKTFRFIEEMHAKASGRKRAASAPKALGEVCMETYC